LFEGELEGGGAITSRQLEQSLAEEQTAAWEATDLTLPNMPASHSLSASTVSCGSATPVFWKTSQPARRGTNSGRGMAEPRASRTFSAAGRTSLPADGDGRKDKQQGGHESQDGGWLVSTAVQPPAAGRCSD